MEKAVALKIKSICSAIDEFLKTIAPDLDFSLDAGEKLEGVNASSCNFKIDCCLTYDGHVETFEGLKHILAESGIHLIQPDDDNDPCIDIDRAVFDNLKISTLKFALMVKQPWLQDVFDSEMATEIAEALQEVEHAGNMEQGRFRQIVEKSLVLLAADKANSKPRGLSGK